jgi:hypothetical protein
MSKDALKNNLVKMFKTNSDHVLREVSRLGSVEQRNTTYRRNGMLNFGGRQLTKISQDIGQRYVVGMGGPPVAGS